METCVSNSKVCVCYKPCRGNANFILGSRDPYVVTGNGAGFVMCWRNNVRWGIHRTDDPKRFMTVDSDEYLLAIPDYSHQAREGFNRDADDTSSKSSTSSNRITTTFKKVIMKLSGNVRWGAGLVFERDLGGGGRSFMFTPHYNVTLRTLEHAKAPPGEVSSPNMSCSAVLMMCRFTMPSKGSAVITSICLWLSSRRLIGIGQQRTSHLPRATTQSI